MPWEKGKSGNPAGRPQGSQNKINLRDTIRNFLDENWSQVMKDFDSVSAEKRLDFVSRLITYAVPKLNSVDYNATVEVTLSKFAEMSIEERQRAINELQKNNLRLTG